MDVRHRFLIFLAFACLPVAVGCSASPGSDASVAVESSTPKGSSEIASVPEPARLPGSLVSGPQIIRPRFSEPAPTIMKLPVSAPAEKRESLAEARRRLASKSVGKAPPVAAAFGSQVVPVSQALVAKQNDYLQQWERLRPSLAALTPEEQEQRQAALKNATLGN